MIESISYTTNQILIELNFVELPIALINGSKMECICKHINSTMKFTDENVYSISLKKVRMKILMKAFQVIKRLNRIRRK